MSTVRVLLVAVVASIAAACSTARQQQPLPVPPAPPQTPRTVDVTGTWELNVESPWGSRASDVVFTQSGGQLSGRMVSPRGEMPLTGTVEGDAVAFGMNLDVQGQQVQIDYAGTVSGDTMSGTLQIGVFGDGKWSGKKKL